MIADLDFPTVGYVWHSVPAAEVRTVRSWDGITLPTETVLQAIDSRVAVVLLSHVLFRSGVLLDVDEITRAAHDAGAMVVLDCYQSAGTILLAHRARVDAAVGGSVKWLCGGPGAGWLYIRPDLQDSLVPRFAGWQADEDPFAFRPGPLQPAAGMWRFLSGTPNVPALAAAEAAYGVIEEVGVEQIRRHSLWATQWLIDLADELEIPLRSERRPERRGDGDPRRGGRGEGGAEADRAAGDRRQPPRRRGQGGAALLHHQGRPGAVPRRTDRDPVRGAR